MRSPMFHLLLLTIGLTACDSSNKTAVNRTAGTGEKEETPIATVMKNAADSAGASATTAPPQPKGEQYRLLGILDPDFNNMVAFALKVPRGWQVNQSFKRQWDGQVPTSQVYVSFRSPDGAQRVDYLPLSNFVYSDGPMARSLREQKQAMGMTDTRMAPNELAPISALAYLKRYFLPQLAQNGMALRNVGNERETAPTPVPAQPGGAPSTKSSASVDGVLPNGNKARIEIRMNAAQMNNNGEVFYSWTVVPSITQTSADNLAATYAHTKTAQESIVNNPAWQQKNNDLVKKGYAANSEASRRNHEMMMGNIAQQTAANTAAHNQRMAAIAQQGAANTARHNERMAAADQRMADYKAADASRDRQHEYYVDNAIRNETKYANPSTGEQVKLDNRYEHSYTDSKGTYYQSNTPIKSSDVNWQELGKVSVNDY